MEYTNDKIKQLIKERDNAIERYDDEIQKEIEKEKAKYKFSWKRFLLVVGGIVIIISAFYFNKKTFPQTSIWSWDYYFNERSVGKK